ncbi:tRNA 2-thiouridine(34) synthase MnmA [Sphingomicrobium astaxanthinifaciens]|uniref:tRNA 2-thiouridine(34) synthase MnmA n=1 Tax=Sphingomicrobium astaxanthinifaciens TaxID=1227949 RepID=UPI001FCB3A90|nr:tRNA 2-thiouridine(34) synthase MnmA [Sphingomicrobium astaxanthinifaciens]MCJ7420832.1 tRNA 2-thiouridine(34) synthase MnmA [Sphingomicrobium astaxanthinifaciens]
MSPTFDLPGAPADARIVVAMSGGVDSSVVACLAARTGAEVIGVTLQLYDHGEAMARSGSCCAGQDIYDAKMVCDRLGIAHYVLDYESRFRTGVIDKFADDYAAGRTPIPCSQCNQGVKFVDLLAFARELGATCLATGHYVRRVVGDDGKPQLWKGRDPRRDQSYFLYGTTLDQLDFLRFPLGDLPKPEVRRLAEEAGLEVAAKPDSQDICFVPDGDYARLVKTLRPETQAPGEIVGLDGEVLGEHPGTVHYTIGQRRGLEIGGQPEPLYVVAIDAAARRVVVGPKAALAVAGAMIEELNWIGETQALVDTKVRSLAPPVRARLSDGAVRFEAPQFGVAPGQSAVFYEGERLLGGGTIAATEPAEMLPA